MIVFMPAVGWAFSGAVKRSLQYLRRDTDLHLAHIVFAACPLPTLCPLPCTVTLDTEAFSERVVVHPDHVEHGCLGSCRDHVHGHDPEHDRDMNRTGRHGVAITREV